jgi:hypothetical protein
MHSGDGPSIAGCGYFTEQHRRHAADDTNAEPRHAPTHVQTQHRGPGVICGGTHTR